MLTMHKKLYDLCPKKTQARHQTIIEAYRELFGEKLPKARQYWTLCSQQVAEDGQILSGSELEQVLDSGLISVSQFCGVDRERHVIDLNSKHIPKARWYCDDFYSCLSKARLFRPAIVNCDLIVMPKTGAPLIGDVISLLTRRGIKDAMVIANFVLKTRYQKDVGAAKIFAELNEVQNFRFFFSRGGWKIYRAGQVYSYDGTKRTSARMGSIIFYR